MARRKNTLMDNEYADQFFPKKMKSQFGSGFVGMHSEAKSEVKKAPKLFPHVDDFLR